MDNLTEKQCGRCKEVKPVSDFYPNKARGDGLAGYCVPCDGEKKKESERRARAALLVMLGGKCRKCGFSNPLALQVDHVNGGGRVERLAITAATHVLIRRVKEAPADYQLLCANCNVIKRHEEAEHVGTRQYVRTFVTERRQPDPNHVPKRRSDALARLAEMLPIVEQRREEERVPERLPQGSWSRHFHRCLWCRRTDRRHACDGLCYACNARVKAFYTGAAEVTAAT